MPPDPPCPFARAEAWIFDLDNTLYHPSARLFDQINARMSGYIMRELGLRRGEADRLRARYWQHHGITLRGLVEDHGIEPTAFLDEVHRIDLSALVPDPPLAAAILRLKGARIIHTNGSRAHAQRVLEARGLDRAFDRIFGIDDKNLVPKPRAEAYEVIVRETGIDPARAVMIEDDARNLAVPKAMGMTTVWLCHRRGEKAPAHVDRRITRLQAFLADPR